MYPALTTNASLMYLATIFRSVHVPSKVFASLFNDDVEDTDA
jgi:hypothetical protein